MRALLIVLALALFAADAEAQRRGHGIAREGDLALTIGIVGLDDIVLRPLEGGIGLRYRVADRTVVGASVGLNVNDVESTQDDDRTSEASAYSTSLSLWTERHVGRSRVVSPFIGLGGRVGVARRDASTSSGFACDPAPECQPLRNENESERLEASGGLLLGAEVKLARGITLGGAYTIGVEYARNESRSVTSRPEGEPDVRRSDTDELRYGVGTTRLNLSIYF